MFIRYNSEIDFDRYLHCNDLEYDCKTFDKKQNTNIISSMFKKRIVKNVTHTNHTVIQVVLRCKEHFAVTSVSL